MSHSCQCLHFIRFTHGSWICQCINNRHLCKPQNAFVREELEQTNQQEHLVLAASSPSLLLLLFCLNCTSLGAPAKSPAQGYCPPHPPPLNVPMKDSRRVQGLQMIKALTRRSANSSFADRHHKRQLKHHYVVLLFNGLSLLCRAWQQH